ncbi:MAG: hypothetical protein AAF804_08910, partial [Bacteroidota bacterium]
FDIKPKGSNTSLQSFRIPIKLIAPAPTVSISDCPSSATPANRLACLQGIVNKLQGESLRQAQTEIGALKEQRSQAQQALNRLRTEYAIAGKSYRIRQAHPDLLSYQSLNSSRFATQSTARDVILRLKGSRYGSYQMKVSAKQWPNEIEPRTIQVRFEAPSDEAPPQEEVAEEILEPAEAAEEETDLQEDKTATEATTDSSEPPLAPEPQDLTLPLWIGMGVLVVLVAFFALRRKKLRPQSTPPAPKAANSSPSYTPLDLAAGEPTQAANDPAEAPEELELDIDITEHAAIPEEEIDKLTLDELATHAQYLPISLDECWLDSAVRHIYLHYESIKGIFKMVRDQNDFVPDEQMIEDVPEIGGFLLGHTYPIGGGRFDLSLEQFVPITADSQNRYTVKFGGTAWSQLDDKLKAHPGIKLIGWFHTHPGHGLFLSEADLREHQSLFKESYQIAMEIDPLTASFDTAFFSWKQSGQLNNLEDRLLSQWWHFTQIDQQIRQRILGQSS